MPQELVYTSAPQGLAPGSSGFCTVARSVGMSPILVAYLESRSGYRHVFPPQSEQAELNPVVWSHGIARFAQNQTAYHLVSRIANAGLDYTRRSNLIAHHLVLENNELRSCGPAALLAAPDVMVSQWSDLPHEISATRPLPNPHPSLLKCTHWENLTGDAGWGGVLAESAIRALSVFVIFQPGTELLPLFAESFALLPESMRWKITFSTYLQDFSNISLFRWKGILAGSLEAKQIREGKDTLILDLANLPQTIPNAQTSFVKIARTGIEAHPLVGQGRKSTVPPPVQQNPFVGSDSSAPPRLGEVEVPAVRSGTYGLAESDLHELTQKRKRPTYSPRSVAEDKERKAQRRFFTIIGFTSLVILALLTLLGDELLNSGGMRKGVLNSFSAMFQRNEQAQDPDEAGQSEPKKEVKPEKQPEEPVDPQPAPAPDAKPKAEGFDLSELEKDDPAGELLENPLTDETDEQEQLRLEEEQRKKEELKKALEEHQRAEKERILQEQRNEMRQAFQKIPEVITLPEATWTPIMGMSKLPENVTYPEFAPFFAYKDYVKLDWIALVTAENWSYQLQLVPQEFLDDPRVQWNLEVSTSPTVGHKPIRPASFFLSEKGLSVEWNQETVKNNFELINKLPFSFLRLTFGPNELTARNIDAAKPGSLTPEELEKKPPKPKNAREMSETATVDFFTEAWYKDIPLWKPMQEKAYSPSGKDALSRMANPEIEFDNAFGTSRYRHGLESFDISSSLILEGSVTSKEMPNTSVQWNPTDVPLKKTINFSTEVKIARKTDPIPLTPIEIVLTMEATPEKIKIRDTSVDLQRELAEKRRTLTRTENEKNDALFQLQQIPRPSEDTRKKELERRMQILKDEITATKREMSETTHLFQLLPEARKKMSDGNISIHYSVFLKGKNGSDNLLLLRAE